MKMGYGFDWQTGVALGYGGLRGAVGLTLAMIIEEDERIDEMIRSKSIFLMSGIALLTLLVTEKQDAATDFTRRAQALQRYAARRQLSAGLVEHIHAFYVYAWKRGGGAACELAFLSELPPSLRLSVEASLATGGIGGAWLFAELPPRAIAAIAKAVVIESYPPSACIVAAGEHLNELMVVCRGTVVRKSLSAMNINDVNHDQVSNFLALPSLTLSLSLSRSPPLGVLSLFMPPPLVERSGK